MRERLEAIVIGSGFGGSLAAHALVGAGLRVLMIERGDWLPRGPENWAPRAIIDLWPGFSADAGYLVTGERRGTAPALFCVGGLSVFYGGVSLRLREADFDPRPADEDGGVPVPPWPYGYKDLEPYYDHAERILGVAGDSVAPGGTLHLDPTAPRRSAPYPHSPPPLSRVSQALADAAGRLGLRPFRLPLAIQHGGSARRGRCVSCLTCDGFPCAVGAKNDVASAVLPDLVARGLRLETNRVAVRLVARKRRVERVECVDRYTGERHTYEADEFILSAGTLGSAHLLLASALHEHNPAADHVGRYLMRHCNGIVFGVFLEPPNPGGRFHKEIGIHDYYFDDRGGAGRRIGSIQQVHPPPVGLAFARVPRVLHALVPPVLSRMTGLLTIAEDASRFENHVGLATGHDRYGLPRMVIRHRYTAADRARRALLLRAARAVLREAGARIFYVHHIHTFSHAVGTARMGDDPLSAPLDHACRFRGIDNLRVLDGSFMPASRAVNPSLTIAANALRAADLMVDGAWSRGAAGPQRHAGGTAAATGTQLPIISTPRES